MKPTINKSQLMKRAWSEYRKSKVGGFGWSRAMTFGQALRLAWKIEKRCI